MDDPETMESAAESAVSTMSGGMSPEEFVDFVWQTWTEGGWLMIPLAALALLIYFEAMSLILRLGKANDDERPNLGHLVEVSHAFGLRKVVVH